MNSQVTARSKPPSKSKQILNSEELKTLNTRSNERGSIQLAGHLGVMGISGLFMDDGE